ncbi:penicillin-binding transpeptidase domain-containing protein [Longimonas halophila]|uniref:penicillin-binding transpeptidase domain-containing protein n=1 Tax=Longimonas halophila TaxID=1469170 RepID=UPI001FE9DD05|nr:penicillin-binding transpeptidase domain-containing protein [Longimonas halophila]
MNARDAIHIRIYVVLTLLGLVPLVIVARIAFIHLAEGDELRAQGQQQARSEQTIPAMRGAILDRNGHALAINTAEYDLGLDPTIDGFAEQAERFYAALGELTGRSADRYRQRVRTRASSQYVMLVRGLNEEQRSTVERWDVPGLIVTPRFARTYSHGTTAAHVLGHVGSDGQGLAGLELRYDEYLTGTPGSRAVKRDRRGRIKAMVGGREVPPEQGQSLVLTIDRMRQVALEDELQRGVEAQGASWGTAIAMDPNTGAVLAMANTPTYNPNRAAAYSERQRRNRAITDRFEPGSTFKFVTAAAALERDYVSLSDTIDTGDGWAVYSGYTMRDISAYGAIPFREVLSKSSNVGTAEVAQRIEPGILYQYARNFGFTQPTWIDLPGEATGVVRRPSEWSRTTRTSMSIGYEVAVTPIQLLTAYSAVANGGTLLQPYLVDERRNYRGKTLWTARPDTVRRVITRETSRQLTDALQDVVEDGTATAAGIASLPVAGKTGTALATENGSYVRSQTRASFVGWFPADDPAVALLVLVGAPRNGMYGGDVAAPIFNRIAERWLTTLPEVSNRMMQAARRPDTNEADDPGSAATASDASSSESAPPVAAATLQVDDPTVLPDFRGVSTRRAVHWLDAKGIQVTLEGRGTVVQQSVAPGAALPNALTLTSE